MSTTPAVSEITARKTEVDDLIEKWITRVSALLGDKPSGPLFHYTSLPTLPKMLDSKTLWATHFRYLNDTSEYHYALNTFAERLEGRVAEYKGLKDVADTVRARLPDKLVIGPYVASLSEDGDSLSQWRGYSWRSAGVNIAFDGDFLHHVCVGFRSSVITDSGRSTLLKCVYKKDEQYKKIDSLIDYLVESIEHTKEDAFLAGVHRALFISMADFLAPAFKDWAFREEQEWRIVVTVPSNGGPAVKFRPAESMLAPYVELPLCDIGNKDIPDGAITAITVGPTPHKELSVESTRRFVEFQHKIRPEIVVSSGLPYRHW